MRILEHTAVVRAWRGASAGRTSSRSKRAAKAILNVGERGKWRRPSVPGRSCSEPLDEMPEARPRRR